MKTNRNFLPITFVIVIVLLAGCQDELPGYYHEKEYELQDFTGVTLGDALQVEIFRADTFKIIAKGEEEDLQDLELRIENKRLTGNYRTGSRSHKRTLVEIYLPELKEVKMHGATITTLTGFYSEEDSLQVTVSGASELLLDNNWKYLAIEVSGASNAVLYGQADKVRASVSGNSELRADDFEVDTYVIEIHGASDASVEVHDTLTGSVNGKSELMYSGNPDVVQMKVASDSKIRKN